MVQVPLLFLRNRCFSCRLELLRAPEALPQLSWAPMLAAGRVASGPSGEARVESQRASSSPSLAWQGVASGCGGAG